MSKRKLLSIVLSLVMVLSAVGMAFGQSEADGAGTFVDMPDNWSTKALNKAVENQLLMGYEEAGKKLIKPDNSLTRAEMAAVVNRAFAASATANISKVTDVANWAWYAKDMAKAVKMGTFALDTKMRPGDRITRQEAFAVLARAFKLASDDGKYRSLDAFSDKADIAAWALKDLDGMAASGYIQGSSGKLNPKANITRAEFAVVMDNLVKQYIDTAEVKTEVVEKGNVMVRSKGATLKDLSVKGDLIIADGVGDGNVTLDNVKVEGRTVVRGGGENSIIIKGNSDIGKIILAKVDGKVRIKVEGNANVEIVYVDNGSDDVLIEGTVKSLELAGDNVTVTATSANLKDAFISGKNSKILVGEGSVIDKVTINGSDAKVEGKGTVKDVTVKAGGNNASVTTPNTKIKVDEGVKGVTAGGNKEVPAGATATNNATGSDAKVDEPSGGGGGGGEPGVTHPTLTLGELKYGDKEIEKDADKFFKVPIGAIKNTSGSAISVKIKGDNFKDKDYNITVTVQRTLNGTIKTEEATVKNVPGLLMNKMYINEFRTLEKLFDHFELIAEVLGGNEHIIGNEGKFEKLKALLDTQVVGAKYTVTFKDGSGQQFKGDEFKFKLVN